jgi:hypothetical protein
MEENELLEMINELVLEYPNDLELGKKIRELFLQGAIQEKNRKNDN